jgi:hypothetical protein
MMAARVVKLSYTEEALFPVESFSCYRDLLLLLRTLFTIENSSQEV